jgi:hypothetical protein
MPLDGPIYMGPANLQPGGQISQRKTRILEIEYSLTKSFLSLVNATASSNARCAAACEAIAILSLSCERLSIK